MYVQIDIKAFFTTPFIVGTGALGDTAAGKPTLKNGRQQPFIPGSAFKGRLRHTCEGLLRALLDDNNAACHTPDPDFTCSLDPARLGTYCPICRLFGSPRRPAPLRFTDLRRVEREAAPTFMRSGVSIRRSRHVAEPERLYSLEAVEALALEYRGEVSGYVTDVDARALLALLFAGIRDLKTIGGSRSSGLGCCRLETTVRLDGRRLEDEAGWLRQGLEEGMNVWRR